MYDIITIGSATVDVFAKTASELITIRTPNEKEEFIAYPAGSKIIIEDLKFLTGGGGTNTAVSFARMGFKTAYLGKLGSDENGKRVLAELKREGIDFLGSYGKGQTGYSVILDSIENDRTILTFKGENNFLRLDDIDLKKFRSAWVYASSMVEDSFKTLEKLCDIAKKRGMKIAFNPSSYLAKLGKGYLKKMLKNTDILILNREEAEYIIGKGEIKDLLRKIHKTGPEIVLITDGKNGVFGLFRSSYYFLQANRVKVVETTGAGDAFASGFLSGFIKKGFEHGLLIGTANATSVVTNLGAKNVLQSYPEALKYIKRCNKVKKV